MEQTNYVLLAVIVLGLTALALIIGVLARGRRHRDLKDRFGPEYDRAVSELGKRKAAEKELEARAKRVEKLPIHPLPPGERRRFEELWRTAQSHFVDSPLTALTEADELVSQVMRARGYPVGDFEQRVADVSVDHGAVVENYRRAHAIAVSAQNGTASTDDMRQAIIYYRALFAELLETPSVPEPEPEPVMH
jgi:hypothetical protein